MNSLLPITINSVFLFISYNNAIYAKYIDDVFFLDMFSKGGRIKLIEQLCERDLGR